MNDTALMEHSPIGSGTVGERTHAKLGNTEELRREVLIEPSALLQKRSGLVVASGAAGVVTESSCAMALATSEHALSFPDASTAVTETL